MSKFGLYSIMSVAIAQAEKVSCDKDRLKPHRGKDLDSYIDTTEFPDAPVGGWTHKKTVWVKCKIEDAEVQLKCNKKGMFQITSEYKDTCKAACTPTRLRKVGERDLDYLVDVRSLDGAFPPGQHKSARCKWLSQMMVPLTCNKDASWEMSQEDASICPRKREGLLVQSMMTQYTGQPDGMINKERWAKVHKTMEAASFEAADTNHDDQIDAVEYLRYYQGLTQEQREQEDYDVFDTDGDNHMSKEEMAAMLRNFEFLEDYAGGDSNLDGRFSTEEMNQSGLIDRGELEDANNDGYITPDEIVNSEYVKDIDSLFSVKDENQDGQISREEAFGKPKRSLRVETP